MRVSPVLGSKVQDVAAYHVKEPDAFFGELPSFSSIALS